MTGPVDTSDTSERDLHTMVAADPVATTPPDLTALRLGGRRRLLRRRVAIGAAAVAVVAALGVPAALLAGDGAASSIGPVDTTPRPQPVPPSPSPDPTPDRPDPDGAAYPGRGELPLPGGGSLVGVWEDSGPVGDVLVVGTVFGYDRIVYAIGQGPTAGVAVGARGERGRVLRLATVLVPGDVPEPDGVDLWNGYREDDGTYLLLGSVPGDVEATLSRPDEEPRPVAQSSTSVLPGFTVFVATGQWDGGWDPLRPAPLTVHLDDGTTVEVRGRTYVS